MTSTVQGNIGGTQQLPPGCKPRDPHQKPDSAWGKNEPMFKMHPDKH